MKKRQIILLEYTEPYDCDYPASNWLLDSRNIRDMIHHKTKNFVTPISILKVVTINDEHSSSFNEMADLIEDVEDEINNTL